MAPTIYTVGHSNTPSEVLADKLASRAVGLLVDVRRYPSSRRNPQFNGPMLSAFLAERGVRYRHEEDLGGHRKPRPESRHTGLRHEGFRAYADHMETAAFRAAAERLIADAGDTTVAVMCAEAAPEHCHRRYLADHLTARGCEVVHILSPEEVRPHRLHPRARVLDGGAVAYPDPAEAQLTLF